MGFHAGFPHPVRQLRGGLAVRRLHEVAGQVGLVIAPGADGFRPGHDGIAQRRHQAQQIVDPQLGDAMNLAQAFGHFIGLLMLQAACEEVDDGAASQTVSVRALDRQDERKAELAVVLRIQLLEPCKFFGAAFGQAGARLLASRFRSDVAGNRCLAGQFRMGTDQRQLLLCRRIRHRILQRQLEGCQRRERPQSGSAFGNPRRMFVDASQRRAECATIATVQGIEGNGHRGGSRQVR